MQNSSALTEFQIRRPLLRDLRLDTLPPKLRDVAAELLCTIVDAALKQGCALEELGKIASKLAPKPTLNDPFQKDRPLVSNLVKRAKDSVAEGEAPEMAAKILVSGLALVDTAYGRLDFSDVVPLLRERSRHELAAVLTVNCGAFGERKPVGTAARKDAIARVRLLSERAASI
ncbi:MAG: hypothetical protein WDO74_17110 [Pseudomonadota bacterium]